MRVTVGGVEIMNTAAEQALPTAHLTTESLSHIETFRTLPLTSVLANAQQPNLNLDKIESVLVDLGQHILIGTATVVVVVCGILIAVGLKREGWKRVVSAIQGLGVGLVGPTIVAIVAGFFTGFARMLN